jgi:hypothetical protein
MRISSGLGSSASLAKAPKTGTWRVSLLRQAFLGALMSLFLAGCGQRFQTVTGSVRFADGTPVKAGEVLLQSKIQEDGSFQLEAPPGSYVARIERADPEDGSRAPTIDWKFANFETSGLNIDVVDGPTEVQIRVAKGPEQPPEDDDDN